MSPPTFGPDPSDTEIHQEFPVAHGTEEGRGRHPGHREALFPRNGSGALEHRPMQRGVANDSPFPDLPLPHLELRLDQRHDVGGEGQQPAHRRQHQRQRDERHVDGRQVGAIRKTGRLQVPDVRPLQHLHAGIGPQACGQLAVPHIHRDHPARSRLQQAVGEAAGRGPHIQADAAARIQPECLQSVLELEAAPAHKRVGGPCHLKRDFQRHRRARLLDAPPRRLHFARQDEPLRVLAAGGQAALDQQEIDPPPGDRHATISPRCRPNRRTFTSASAASWIPSDDSP